MRKNKLTHLLEPGMRLYFVFLLLFAAAPTPSGRRRSSSISTR